MRRNRVEPELQDFRIIAAGGVVMPRHIGLVVIHRSQAFIGNGETTNILSESSVNSDSTASPISSVTMHLGMGKLGGFVA